MRAVVCNAYGPPDKLMIGDLPSPEPGSDEVRIEVWSAGVNFPDTLIIEGKYQQKPAMPFAPGFEVAGKIAELGSAVRGWQIGDRVMSLTSSGYGAFAEQAVARAAEVVPIPEGLDYATATALYTAYGTAYHGLVQRGGLKAGETLVVLGASGGVGLASVELGKALGATVLAVGRTEDRLSIARDKGADHLVSYNGDLKARILELTDGKGADVCIDMLGGAAFAAMSRAMNWGGRLLIVGFTSGEIPQLAVNLTLLKGYSVIGVYWGQFITRDPVGHMANFKALGEMITSGKIRPYIGGLFRLDETPAALNTLLNRQVTGKLVINVRSE
jgi:NADPH:quinone reductase